MSLKRKEKLGRRSPTIFSLSYKLSREGVVPRTVAWYAKICDKGGSSIRVHTQSGGDAYVLFVVCVDVCGYGKASGNPIRMEAPGELAGKEKRGTSKQGPNIGCQEFSYLDATLGKSRAFPRKNSFSVDATE